MNTATFGRPPKNGKKPQQQKIKEKPQLTQLETVRNGDGFFSPLRQTYKKRELFSLHAQPTRATHTWADAGMARGRK